MEPIELTPIGVIHSPFAEPGEAPHQGAEADAPAEIVLADGMAEGLQGLEAGDWLWVLYHFHRSGPARMLVHPRGDRSRPLKGVFATRAPIRPCPIGLSLARLEAIDGQVMRVRGLEAIDGTPVFDIKPYAAGLDRPRPEKKP